MNNRGTAAMICFVLICFGRYVAQYSAEENKGGSKANEQQVIRAGSRDGRRREQKEAKYSNQNQEAQ